MPAAVLIIEDDAGLQEIMGHVLELEGYRVEIAGTAEAALRRVRARQHDVILLDLILPDADGVLLLARLRKARPGIEARTLLMTGFTSQEPVVRYLKSLSAGFLHKPFAAGELVRAVERLARARGETATAAGSRSS